MRVKRGKEEFQLFSLSAASAQILGRKQKVPSCADALSARVWVLCADVMVLQLRGLRSCFAADAGRLVGWPAGTQ